jgi:hypothetical protein
MTNNVVSIKNGQVVSDNRQANADVIAMLNKYLSMAKSGEIVEVTVVAVYFDRSFLFETGGIKSRLMADVLFNAATEVVK